MSTNIFVSYTLRDGEVTRQNLRHFVTLLSPSCDVFVDCLKDQHRLHPQLLIIKNIFRAHLILIVESSDVYKSPWVRLEILLARLLLKPIARVTVPRLLS